MIFVGDDWAEDHHDVYVMDADGARLASRRLPEGLAGSGALHELIADHVGDPRTSPQALLLGGVGQLRHRRGAVSAGLGGTQTATADSSPGRQKTSMTLPGLTFASQIAGIVAILRAGNCPPTALRTKRSSSTSQ